MGKTNPVKVDWSYFIAAINELCNIRPERELDIQMKKIHSWIIDKWLAGFTTASLLFILELHNQNSKNCKYKIT